MKDLTKALPTMPETTLVKRLHAERVALDAALDELDTITQEATEWSIRVRDHSNKYGAVKKELVRRYAEARV